MNFNVNIPANGQVVNCTPGAFKFLRITSADVAFQISFDGGNFVNSRQNEYYTRPSSRVSFRSLNGLAANVAYSCDNNPIAGQDTAQSVILNQARGCGGSGIAISLAKAKAKGGADYVYNAGNAVDLTVANTVLYIPGVVGGKKRKSIYFDNRNSAQDCCIFDGDGNLFQYLKTGKDTPVFETSSDFYAAGMGGVCNNFIYAETFYEKSNA